VQFLWRTTNQKAFSGLHLRWLVTDPVEIDEQMSRTGEHLVDAIGRRVLDQAWVVHPPQECLDGGGLLRPQPTCSLRAFDIELVEVGKSLGTAPCR